MQVAYTLPLPTTNQFSGSYLTSSSKHWTCSVVLTARKRCEADSSERGKTLTHDPVYSDYVIKAGRILIDCLHSDSFL